MRCVGGRGGKEFLGGGLGWVVFWWFGWMDRSRECLGFGDVCRGGDGWRGVCGGGVCEWCGGRGGGQDAARPLPGKLFLVANLGEIGFDGFGCVGGFDWTVVTGAVGEAVVLQEETDANVFAVD